MTPRVQTKRPQSVLRLRRDSDQWYSGEGLPRAALPRTHEDTTYAPLAAEPFSSAVEHDAPGPGHGGGATPRFWTPTTPPTNCWPEAPWGGLGRGIGGGVQGGQLGGGLGGAWGGGSGRVGWGGGPCGGGGVVGVLGPVESPPPWPWHLARHRRTRGSCDPRSPSQGLFHMAAPALR